MTPRLVQETKEPQPPPPTPPKNTPQTTSSNVEIHVSCKNLTNMDFLSKSDPMVVLFTEERGNRGKVWKEHARTEIIWDNLDPKFVTPFNIEYEFERHQNLKFEVYDCDSEARDLDKHDFIGHVVISMGSIMGEYNSTVIKPLMDRNRRKLPSSTIKLKAEEMRDCKDVVLLHFKGKKLEKKSFFSASNPFLVLSRTTYTEEESGGLMRRGSCMPVHKTEVLKKNLNPDWKPFELPLITLCNGDVMRPIKIECFDWRSNGSHVLIGSCETTVDNMLAVEGFQKPLINEQKLDKKRYKDSGELLLQRISVGTTVSFLDYITGGLELCFHVAIDFTKSNGVPTHPSSLHYLGEPGHEAETTNEYIQALSSVGKICEDYDSDKLMPAYGIGAMIGGQVQHAFHLNRAQNPECKGITGVRDAYIQCLSQVELSEPCNFAPVIHLVKEIAAQQEQSVEKYHILLILTDGVIEDMDDTKLAIIEASHHPMSIIIVGVGSADFKAMEVLDSDTGLLSHNGLTAEHDIVQFVPYNKFEGDYASDDLAHEVLREVPTQLVSYMASRGIQPGPKPQPRSDIQPLIKDTVKQKHHKTPTHRRESNAVQYKSDDCAQAGALGAPPTNTNQSSNIPRFSRHNNSYG